MQVSTKNEQECAMTTSVIDVRRQAKILVERAEIKRQSRMLAYEEVGQSIGMSGSWVRGFIKGYDRYSLNHVIALNIKSLYERACSRVENNSERLRRDIQDAAYESNRNQYRIEAKACVDSRALLHPNEL